jgi:hypothetical protein
MAIARIASTPTNSKATSSIQTIELDVDRPGSIRQPSAKQHRLHRTNPVDTILPRSPFNPKKRGYELGFDICYLGGGGITLTIALRGPCTESITFTGTRAGF